MLGVCVACSEISRTQTVNCCLLIPALIIDENSRDILLQDSNSPYIVLYRTVLYRTIYDIWVAHGDSDGTFCAFLTNFIARRLSK